MASSRLERTLLHKSFGVFRYSAELDSYGITTPTEQIIAIASFLRESLGTAESLPSIRDESQIHEWMKTALASYIGDSFHRSFAPEPLESLVLETADLVVWNLYEDFSELLNIKCGSTAYPWAARKLRERGYVVDLAALD